MNSIPPAMRAVQILAYDAKPESMAVTRIPVPRPGPGEVLVRMAAAPINPSDVTFISGLYGVKKPLPAGSGLEGSGTVVAPGGGVVARVGMGEGRARQRAGAQNREGNLDEYTET